jgi:hypothetical protein
MRLGNDIVKKSQVNMISIILYNALSTEMYHRIDTKMYVGKNV